MKTNAAPFMPVVVRPLARQPIGLALVLALVAAAVTAALIVAYFELGMDPELFVRDPNALAHQPEYYGVISNLSVMGWITAAAAALFAARLVRRGGGAPGARYALLYGGWLSAVAAVDDMFMLHEGASERAGVPEELIMLVYAVLGVAWLVRSWRTVAEGEWLLAVGGLAGLACSVVLDLEAVHVRGEVLFEDMAKFFGILFWTAFLLRLGWHESRKVSRSGRA